MEKYGVEEIEDTKTAGAGARTCPACGSDLAPEETTGIRLCPNCGTRPWEPVHPTK